MTLSATAPSKITIQGDLDNLLDAIGAKLQISETLCADAAKRYVTISEWLNKDGSDLAVYSPDIYPQGSFSIGTTVRPRGKDEYDLDLVCLFNEDELDLPDPVGLLDMVEARLKAHETYEGMIERKNRCIRVNYANLFHMDILPACPNPKISELFGEYALKVPDCILQEWKDSNPKGYAAWFRAKAESAWVDFRKSLDPMPQQQSYDELHILQRVVQLMKRNRDVALSALDLKARPISIVLTTLAARNYDGNTSLIEALVNILERIDGEIKSADADGKDRIIILNPTNKDEDLSERWENDSDLYKVFVNWIENFRQLIAELRQQPGLQEVTKHLEKMFGENVAKSVIEDYVKRVSVMRSDGQIATAYTTGLIVSSETENSIPIRSNTFHGTA